MADISAHNIEEDLAGQVQAAAAVGSAVRIVGNDSKAFYGQIVDAGLLSAGLHRGVIDYDPAELVITLRGGCRVDEVVALLRENGQMFAFDPPDFDVRATIGGMVASGLAGPRRAYAGAMRDFVLGVRMIDGRGVVQNFGGRVIKNVAGFDVARLMVGALGTLGVLLEVSIRVVPTPETELTLSFEHPDPDTHIRWINNIAGKPLPLSASMWCDGISYIRLSGSEQGVGQAARDLGGDLAGNPGSDVAGDLWRQLAEQQHAFFSCSEPLTRVALPPTTNHLGGENAPLIEWGGAQRWYRGEVDLAGLRGQAEARGGSVCAYRNHPAHRSVFHPLPQAVLKLQRHIKSSFDPAGIFNPGRMYPEL